MRDEICDECQGCGYVEYIARSYFSESFGNYLPREEVAECRKCSGTGLLEVFDEGGATLENNRKD